MMYWKLAIQNIRRSLRDYIIYFVTLTLTAALMYSFLALGFSSDVLAMAENMSMLTTGILLMSALVAFMSSFVIGYAIRFMLGRRKKEFATYELIGMPFRSGVRIRMTTSPASMAAGVNTLVMLVLQSRMTKSTSLAAA